MKRCIVTGHEGADFDAVSGITLPTMLRYAERHNVSLYAVNLPEGVHRPSSWKKLVAIALAFSKFDEVLWLDADVVIVDAAENIFDAVPAEAHHAMVRHQTPEGDVPNAGVWLMRRGILPHLMACAMRDDLVHHRWWEQRAIINQMGFVEGDGGLCRHETVTPLYTATHWLDESWNVWRDSPPEAKASRKFCHACGTSGANRISLLTEWSNAFAT